MSYISSNIALAPPSLDLNIYLLLLFSDAGGNHAQNNPLYFGVSTLLSSSSSSRQSSAAGSLLRLRSSQPHSTYTDLEQVREEENGYTSLTPTPANQTTYNSISTSPEPHYEQIPAQRVRGGISESSDAGSCSRLLGATVASPPVGQGTCQQSGQYDRLGEHENENPYVAEPSANGYVMGHEARARREMYVELPPAAELRGMAES